MFEKVAHEKMTGRRLYVWLKDEIKFKTKNGKPLTLSNVYITLRNPFYHGTFEYPRKSGQWYTGKHTPIITKELFDTVQESIAQHIIKRYVYYGCCRFNDRNCKSGYMREEDLIEQLTLLIGKVDLDQIGMKEQIKSEIERHKKFQSDVLGKKEPSIKVSAVDIRNYAKYLLREDTIYEKRELLSCLKSRILMSNKKVVISIKQH